MLIGLGWFVKYVSLIFCERIILNCLNYLETN